MELSEKEIQELKDKRVSIEELDDRYFIFSNFRDTLEVENTIEIENILRLLNENICSFKEIVDKFKSIKDPEYDYPCLKYLLANKKLFEELIQNNRLNTDDLKYLLNRIDNFNQLSWLCREEGLLIKKILNEFVLNKELIDRFYTMIENRWYKEENIYTIFDLIASQNKNNEEVLKLNELNKYIAYSFDEKQKLELIEILRNNEIAQNRLKEIVDNHLEPNYDFSSLMTWLKKQEKKGTWNI